MQWTVRFCVLCTERQTVEVIGLTVKKRWLYFSIILAAAVILSAVIWFAVARYPALPEVKYNLSYVDSCQTFAQAFEEADLALTGSPVSLRSYKLHGVVFTDVQIKVLEKLKGEIPGDTVFVTYTGGIYDGVRYTSEEIVIPQAGDETYLFLTAKSDGHTAKHHALHAFQGTYRLQPGPGGIKPLVQSNAGVIPFNPENHLEQELLQGDFAAEIKELVK